MAKRVMQFRYYSDNDSKNQPMYTNEDAQRSISKITLRNGKIFSDYKNITQLGIQTLPGTKFYLNDGINPIIVGSTGIYELDLVGVTTITKLTFNEDSLKTIENLPNAYLIIDIIYEGTIE